MASFCATCGIGTDEPLRIEYHDRTADFCSFECAVTRLAPACTRCRCTILGHGKYGRDEKIYCCGHCVEQAEQEAGIYV